MMCEETEWERERSQKAAEAIRELSNYVNGNHGAYKPLVEAMREEHRTLQQAMTGFMLAWFCDLASRRESEYDLRNEASVRLAKKIVEKFEEMQWGLPLI